MSDGRAPATSTRELRWLYESGATARQAGSAVPRRDTSQSSAPGCGCAARGTRRRRGGHAPAGLGAAIRRAGAAGHCARPRERRSGRIPASVAADRTTVEGRPSRTAMAWSPDGRSIAFTRSEGRPATALSSAHLTSRGDSSCRHGGRFQSLLLTRRTLAWILERRRAEEDRSRWQQPSGGDL